MSENVIKNKSFKLAIRIVKIYQYLGTEKKEFTIAKQVLRSGTSIGDLIREAEHAESKTDFKHKMAIAQKEANETLYWLELLKETDYLTKEQFQTLYDDTVEIIKLLTSIIKTTKQNLSTKARINTL